MFAGKWGKSLILSLTLWSGGITAYAAETTQAQDPIQADAPKEVVEISRIHALQALGQLEQLQAQQKALFNTRVEQNGLLDPAQPLPPEALLPGLEPVSVLALLFGMGTAMALIGGIWGMRRRRDQIMSAASVRQSQPMQPINPEQPERDYSDQMQQALQRGLELSEEDEEKLIPVITDEVKPAPTAVVIQRVKGSPKAPTIPTAPTHEPHPHFAQPQPIPEQPQPSLEQATQPLPDNVVPFERPRRPDEEVKKSIRAKICNYHPPVKEESGYIVTDGTDDMDLFMNLEFIDPPQIELDDTRD